MTLLERMRRARESAVSTEATAPFAWTIRRPTDVEFVQARAEGTPMAMLAFVIGWAKQDGSPVTTIDLGIPDGDGHPLPFDQEAAIEYLCERMAMFKTVCDAITDAYIAHHAKVAEAAKN